MRTMKGLTIERIEQVTGGVLHMSVLTKAGIFASFERETLRKGSPRARWGFGAMLQREVSDIVTDSRKAGPGSLFGAIQGERVDGHRFIAQVFDQGAICVLSERDLTKEELISDAAIQAAQTVETGVSQMSEWKENPKEARRERFVKSFQGKPENETGLLHIEAGTTQAGTPAEILPAGLDSAAGGLGIAPDGTIPRFWIEVTDTQEALRKIAEEYLKILGTPVVGITGSVGKTSTKEMIASVLQTHYRTLKTEGNFNNGLGLPLTVFRLREEHEIAVLEMGVSHFGDMDQLAQIARPDTMVITNIGTCHLEFLKDRDGIMRAKTEVFRYMKPSGHVILNGNDDKLRTIEEVNGNRPLWFGVASDTEGTEDLCVGEKMDYPGNLPASGLVCAADIRPLGFEGTRCTIRTPKGSFEVKVPVPGLHNVSNAAAAAAVGLVYGLSLEEIRKGIESAETISGRFRILKTEDWTVIDDCYNANPVSMKSSLSVLSGGKPEEGRRVAILGDMGELGEDEAALHKEVGAYAAGCCDRLIAIGTLSRQIYEEALQKKTTLSAVWYPDVDSFLEKKDAEVKKGDIVLVKASHFMGFSRIVDALTKSVKG
ncbi:MAG: UDP-N-acetylmuramoyl-tripeptide--D-alanyl-D-alanine ligase [Lachnospiraceae bacterium]|nr:UDP-N-acetylmuramoyl-tripeptide--D-alanyl-D-alanine ligase [Lachnospiraceae bacterium]